MEGTEGKVEAGGCGSVALEKDDGIKYAARNVCTPRDGLDALILHVFVPDGQAAKVLRMAYRRVSAEVRAGTVVLVTVCNAQCIFKRTRGAPQMIF
ncbi:hypothetical protein BC829DRAFT_400166 [Chytridium lagenaria]|nr:hypothetical protein BC829DRAFT_400166 [Chytridium lagenaria]